MHANYHTIILYRHLARAALWPPLIYWFTQTFYVSNCNTQRKLLRVTYLFIFTMETMISLFTFKQDYETIVSVTALILCFIS